MQATFRDKRGVTVSDEQRDRFYRELDAANLSPVWEVIGDLVPLQPKTPCVPFIWRYKDVRSHIVETGNYINMKGAERRALVLENPGIRGRSAITQTLYASYQYILPGEVAPSHRHVPSALRFILEGRGAHTAVEGEKAMLAPGDVVLTPNWTWHDHGNESEEPVVWLDGLDVPLISHLDNCFKEYLPDDEQPLSRPAGDSLARFGYGMKPVDHKIETKASPMFHYPYERTREALETMRRADRWDPCHGLKMQYLNPVTADHVIPTIGIFMQLLPKGMKTTPYRSVDGTVCSVIEGKGKTVIGDRTFTWEPRDVFVIPSWFPYHHEVEDDTVIFSFSDRPVHEKLGMWREQRGNH